MQNQKDAMYLYFKEIVYLPPPKWQMKRSMLRCYLLIMYFFNIVLV